MNKLKCYVGLNNRFVMCEQFPDDEEHCGLNDMLKEFIQDDYYIQDEPLEQGFYNIEFGFEWANDDLDEEYLVVKDIKKINGMKILKDQTALVGPIIIGEDNEKK